MGLSGSTTGCILILCGFVALPFLFQGKEKFVFFEVRTSVLQIHDNSETKAAP